MVRTCRDNGVIGINAWGAWSPGCIWPDYEPGYLHSDMSDISWRGHWNTFRMFTRGFTPGQANAYLLARLAWDPDAGIEQIAREFAALHVGPANADAAAEALLATEDTFNEEYIKGTYPVYIKWTMLFAPRDEFMERGYANSSLAEVLAGNNRAMRHTEKMERAFAATDPTKAPDAKRYTRFKEGIEKTA